MPERTRALTSPWADRRDALRRHFDDGAERWRRITSADAPLGRIRETVRAGRRTMRAHLLDALPPDLTGRTVLDAGCGPGSATLELAARGATVVAVDISDGVLDVARERIEEAGLSRSVALVGGDMLDVAADGAFDHVVAMDTLIHYGEEELVAAVEQLARAARSSLHFTVAPWTPLLGAMHAVGKLFPRPSRAPSVRPIRPERLATTLAPRLDHGLRQGDRIRSGFYISHALHAERGRTSPRTDRTSHTGTSDRARASVHGESAAP